MTYKELYQEAKRNGLENEQIDIFVETDDPFYSGFAHTIYLETWIKDEKPFVQAGNVHRRCRPKWQK